MSTFSATMQPLEMFNVCKGFVAHGKISETQQTFGFNFLLSEFEYRFSVPKKKEKKTRLAPHYNVLACWAYRTGK